MMSSFAWWTTLLAPMQLAPQRHATVCCQASDDADFIERGLEAFFESGEMMAMIDGDGDESDEFYNDDDRFEQELIEELNYPAKALVEQAFLGPGTPLPANPACQSAAAAAAAVHDEGVVKLDSVLSSGVASELRQFILAELELAKARERTAADGSHFGLQEMRLSNVLAPEVRWDLRLPMR